MPGGAALLSGRADPVNATGAAASAHPRSTRPPSRGREGGSGTGEDRDLRHISAVPPPGCRHRAGRSRAAYAPRGHPGGQVIARPPRTCRCAWNTVWWAAAPVLKTRRYPSPNPSASAIARAASKRWGGRCGLTLREVGGVRVVAARDHQHVRGGLRVEVAEGEGRLALVDHVGRDVPGDDLAEQAVLGGRVAHGDSMPHPPRAPRWADRVVRRVNRLPGLRVLLP